MNKFKLEKDLSDSRRMRGKGDEPAPHFRTFEPKPPTREEPSSKTCAKASSNTYAKASMYTVHKIADVKEGYVCVRNIIPCKIKLIRTVRNPKHKDGPPKRQFVATDVFSDKVYKATFSLSGTCVVPCVTYTDCQLVDISEDDSSVILLDDKGNLKFNVKLPTKEALRSRIIVGFAEGKDVFVSVVSAMGRTEIIDSYVLDPK